MYSDCRCLPRREFGILLHITSLPGVGECGNLGSDAYRFADFLASSGARVWQVLPLVPTHQGGSPYLGESAHAGNPLLVSPKQLLDDELISSEELDEFIHGSEDGGDFQSAHQWLLMRAFSRYRQCSTDLSEDIIRFAKENEYWLPDYTLYHAIKNLYDNAPWFDWPAPLRNRDAQALAAARTKYRDEIQFGVFAQYLFWKQWSELKTYANRHGIRIMGDMPMFVAHDSAEVWAFPDYFQLDATGHAVSVAGVPPDYFSDTGQRWGNPLYEWRSMQQDGFTWWINRFRSQLKLFDLLRIDHFRGYESYWSIPAQSEDATQGRWRKSPGDALFATLSQAVDPLPLIAEDLGEITSAVHELRQRLGFPGMRVLQFAFDGGADNLHLPHNHLECSVVYTGTHDNSTTLGWFRQLAPAQQQRVYEYLGDPQVTMPWALIRAAMASVARLGIFPLQDIMELDDTHRMNMPGTESGNWSWRFDWSSLPFGTADRIAHLASVYGR